MRLSVVLCTRDGEAFVERQLRTILQQRRPPDELIVRDDRSTDGTLAILRGILDGAPFSTSIETNAEVLGVAANFDAAIGAASGDVIVLCDQDDEWEPHHLATIEQAFSIEPDLLAWCTDAWLIDADGQPVHSTLWTRLGLSPRARRAFTRDGTLAQLCRGNVVAGATLAMSHRLVPHVRPIPDGVAHDELIALVAALADGLRATEATTVRYRLHDANTVGLPSRSPRALIAARRDDVAARAHELEVCTLAAERGRQIGASTAALELLAKRVALVFVRNALDDRARRRLVPVIGHLLRGHYHQSAHGLRSAVHDLVVGR